MQKDRSRQADASLRSLEAFQKAKGNRLRGTLENYQRRLFDGEDMDIAIRRAKYELDQLDAECDRRRERIESRRHVQVNAPLLSNLALLVTAS